MSRVIVITGGGEGLGRAIARRFAAGGDYKLVLLGRTLAKLEAVVAEVGNGALAVKCDVASPESVRQAFAQIAKTHPNIHILVNNAAIYEPYMVAKARDEQILNSIGTNLAGPIFCTRAAIPMLPRGGHIINISSESVGMLFPRLTLYQSTKAGLERFSHAMFHELEPSGIRVSCVRAGQMFDRENWKPANMGDPEAWAEFREVCLAAGVDLMKRPLSTFASAAEIVYVVANLPPDVQIEFTAQHAWNPA